MNSHHGAVSTPTFASFETALPDEESRQRRSLLTQTQKEQRSRYMPRKDGTGPKGRGAMTGRGLGCCVGVAPGVGEAGPEPLPPRRGMEPYWGERRGRGRGQGSGRGRRWRRRCGGRGLGFGQGRLRQADGSELKVVARSAASLQQEVTAARQQRVRLEETVLKLRTRLDELERAVEAKGEPRE